MFKLSTELTGEERAKVTAAIDLMNNQFPPHCLRISPAISSDRDYIMVKKSQGCYSHVGMVGGSQELNLGNGCYNQATIIHMFGHALGLYHEQSRPDRDQYVEIFRNNIRPLNAYNFDKRSSYNVVTSVPYDGRSIMHYKHRAYSKNSLTTIRSKIPGLPEEELGSSDKFTDRDIAKLILLYGCL